MQTSSNKRRIVYSNNSEGLSHLNLILTDSSPQASSSAGSDLTTLGTGHSEATDGTGLAHVLLVTSTMGMVNRVHRHTSGDGPLVALSLVLVESTSSLQQRLVRAASAGHDADGTTAQVGESTLGTGGHADTGGLLVLVLSDDDAVVSGGLGDLALVADLGLDVADHGSLGQITERKDVADGKSSCTGEDSNVNGTAEKVVLTTKDISGLWLLCCDGLYLTHQTNMKS